MSLRTTLHVCVILLFACILVSPAQAQTFQVGDVFGAVGNGQVNWYHPDGTLVKTLDDLSGGFTTGMAFDKAGNLYVTNFSAGNVSKFDNTGTLIGNLPTAGFGAPESLVFDSAGNLFVGQANSGTISKLDAAGNQLAVFSVSTEDRGADWVELQADQHTIFYTSEGTHILSFDTTANVQGPPFAALGGTNAFALRILPTGGVLVADSQIVSRLDTTGTIVQTYGVGAGGLFGLNLDPDGVHFWTSDFGNGTIYQVRIDNGTIDHTIVTGSGSLFGVAVFGEHTAGGGTTVTTCAAFSAKVELRTTRNKFEVEGSCTLGKGSNGLNFVTDDLTLTIGATSFTIPKNSLKVNLAGSFTFEGNINKQELEVSVTPSKTAPGKFSFEFEGPGNPTGGANPVAVTLTIGDDTGTGKAKVTTRLD